MTTLRRQPGDGLKVTAQVQGLARRLAHARETERRALTRELHDRVGPSLTALNILLTRLASELPRGVPPRTREGLRESLQLVEATAESIESVMTELSEPGLAEQGLVAVLRRHAEAYSRRTGIGLTVIGREPEPRLPPDAEVALLRIAQEALTNVARHARATRANVVVRQEHGRVTLRVTDNGAGFVPHRNAADAPRRRGISNMRERARAIGASFRIAALRGAGTGVIVELEHRA
jgi:signal transduction histidine kinase